MSPSHGCVCGFHPDCCGDASFQDIQIQESLRSCAVLNKLLAEPKFQPLALFRPLALMTSDLSRQRG
jgi:hypothetical protein